MEALCNIFIVSVLRKRAVGFDLQEEVKEIVNVDTGHWIHN